MQREHEEQEDKTRARDYDDDEPNSTTGSRDWLILLLLIDFSFASLESNDFVGKEGVSSVSCLEMEEEKYHENQRSILSLKFPVCVSSFTCMSFTCLVCVTPSHHLSFLFLFFLRWNGWGGKISLEKVLCRKFSLVLYSASLFRW